MIEIKDTVDEDTERLEMAQAAILDARTNFETFLLLFRPPGACEYVYSKLHQYLVEMVQDLADLKIGRRQAVSVSPQHGKSEILAKLAVAWLMGRYPGIQIALTSFSVDLVTESSKAVRDLVEHPLYALIFPKAGIVPGSNRADNWKMTTGSTLRAKSVGQKLTGRRVDLLIIDDPHSGREEAESATMRRRIVQWYYADCMSRLSPNAAVFIINTRWHPQDLIGHLTSKEVVERLRLDKQEKEIFEVTNIPAICEDEENDPLGRKVGEAAFPEVRGVEFLASVKSQYEASGTLYEWDSQFQGRPKATGSGQADTSKLKFISREEVPKHLEVKMSWDLAVAEGQKSDFHVSALTAYDWEEDIFYILKIHKSRTKWGVARRHFIDMAREEQQEYGVQNLGIEAIAGFGAVYSDIKQQLLGELHVTPRNPPKGGKLLRATPWINKIEARKVCLVRGAWNSDFTDSLSVFPEGEHDDDIDAVSVGWEMHTGTRRNGAADGKPPPAGVGKSEAAKRKEQEEAAKRAMEAEKLESDYDLEAFVRRRKAPSFTPAPKEIKEAFLQPAVRPSGGTKRFS